jgi:predicted HicB family RNase H-like nuclease
VIILRVDEALAFKLSKEAEELGISRNALITMKLRESDHR